MCSDAAGMIWESDAGGGGDVSTVEESAVGVELDLDSDLEFVLTLLARLLRRPTCISAYFCAAEGPLLVVLARRLEGRGCGVGLDGRLEAMSLSMLRAREVLRRTSSRYSAVVASSSSGWFLMVTLGMKWFQS
jgi:hypothetical protein